MKDLEKLDQIGVYAMINNRTNKVYIGSTKTSFKKRLNIHQFFIDLHPNGQFN